MRSPSIDPAAIEDLYTALSGLLKASSGSIVAATAGVDYVAPSALSAYALDSAAAHKASPETITGGWSFTAPKIDFTGQLIVGANAPGSANARLEVTGASGANAFAVYTSSGSQAFIVSGDGTGTFAGSFIAGGGIHSQSTGSGFNFYRRDNATYAGTLYSGGGEVSIYCNAFGGNVLTINASGGATIPGSIGINGAAPPAKPAITGSRGGNAALASLLTGLASYGFITDNTTP